MASPVLHKMICGGFSEGATRRLLLEEVDGGAFEELLNLWSGKEGRAEQELGDVLVMASVADRLEMLDVSAVLEAAIIGELHGEVCAEMVMMSRRLGLRQVEAAAWGMAVERFVEVSGTAGFTGLDEETVGKLLEEDMLGVAKEEEAFEGLVAWMKGGPGGGLRGRELLGKIRLCFMEQDYLEEKARMMLPEEYREWVEGLVGEALRVKAAVRAKAAVELGQLGAKALTRRSGWGVEWGRYSEGAGGRRLKGHTHGVRALAVCDGRMCSGSADGSIRAWSLGTLEAERVLPGKESEGVYALAVWEGQLISGHESGKVRVWDVGTGERRRELDGHATSVRSLCVLGSRLAVGLSHESIKVWAMGPGPEWPCERTLKGHTSWVASLVGWKGRLISGSADQTIRVWELETGGQVAALAGHRGPVYGLLVHGERLFSASGDGTIGIWAAGTWAALAGVRAYDLGASGRLPRCLAVSGSKLVSGPVGCILGTQCEVRVWDAESLAFERTVLQPVGADVMCLVALGGEVWGGVAGDVVVWGRE